MVNNRNEDNTKNKKSIYYELKEFHDLNQDVLYSFQDFQTDGLKEYKAIKDKLSVFHDYEKNRLANDLVRVILYDIENEEKFNNVKDYIKLNPIINYYDNFAKIFKDSLEFSNKLKLKNKAAKVVKNILMESTENEEIKLGIVMAAFCGIKNLNELLEVFSIHNEYLFYVIKAYEYIGNCNNIIFKIAETAYGYGKVFCVMNLRPTTYEIRKWMIEDGCNNNVGVTELLSYCMLSIDILEYLENTEFDKEGLEGISKSFSMLLSDYGMEDIKNSIKVCNKLIEIIDKVNGEIYSLYAVISMIYSIEAIIVEEYKNGQNSGFNKFNDGYKDIVERCKKICEKPIWHEILNSEVFNIDIESSVLISCIEKTKYKLRKKEFEAMLRRDTLNALLYKYAFAIGNKAIKKCAFDLGLKMLPMDKILRGQDELKIETLIYDDIAQICFFIIIKYSKYEEFEDRYKELNLQALKSPLIETRIQAAGNLQRFREEFDVYDKEVINDAISSEMVMQVRRALNLLLIKSYNKTKKYVEVFDYMRIDPHVKDIYLITLKIAGTEQVDMSEVYNKIYEDDILYLKRELDNFDDPNAIEVLTSNGYVIGHIPRENSTILKNLLVKGKYLYGKVTKISEDYNDIEIKIYLSYKDVIEEITTTLSLLSGEKNSYIQ